MSESDQSKAERRNRKDSPNPSPSTDGLYQIFTELSEGKGSIKFPSRVEGVTTKFLANAKYSSTLVSLALDGPYINQSVVKDLCRLIEASKSLQSLRIVNHALTVESFTSIYSRLEIPQNHQLKVRWLLTQFCFSLDFAERIKDLSILSSLTFDTPHLQIDMISVARALAGGIQQNTSLTSFSMKGIIPLCLLLAGSVPTISFPAHLLNDKAVKKLVSGVKTNTTLLSLDLSDNLFGDSGMAQTASEISAHLFFQVLARFANVWKSIKHFEPYPSTTFTSNPMHMHPF